MKKIKSFKLITILFTFALIIINTISVYASSSTSFTMTFDNHRRFIRTQDAYLPNQTITTLDLNEPHDLFIDNNDNLYIADSANKRIVKYNISSGEVVQVITHEELEYPKGIYVTEEFELFVADPQASKIFRFNEEGELLESFSKPTSVTYSDQDFNPMRIAVDRARSMYIVGEGVYDGIIQLSNSGEFLGYFTTNRVSLSFVQKLQDIFFTDEQKQTLLGRIPITFSNVFVDKQGIVYTTTMGDDDYKVKKHNTAGGNMFSGYNIATDDINDIYVDSQGIIYTVSKNGIIFVYTSDGEYIYSLGAWNPNEDISGLYHSLESIAVDSNGYLWTIDSEKSFIQSFEPTDYARKIYNALSLFDNGEYEQAIDLWKEVIRLNQNSTIAHNNISKNYLLQQDYNLTIHHSKLAGNRYVYSQAFWEIRNIWLQNNLTYIFIGVIAVFIFSLINKHLLSRSNMIEKIKNKSKKIKDIRLISDLLFFFDFFVHPIDSFYELKMGNKGSYLSATIIFIVSFLIYFWNLIGMGFIYQYIRIEDIDINAVTLGYFSIALLFVICNYLVTSINDGEGSLGDIYKMVVYSLGPIVMASAIVTISSHFFTFNETFLLVLLINVAYVWTLVNILLGVQEVHGYDTRVAIKSILITIFFMIIIAVILILIILMATQVYEFFIAILKEVYRNVTR